MKVKTLFLSLFFVVSGHAVAEPTEVVPEYLDEADKGVNDTRPLTLPDGTDTTVGEFRKDTIEHVVRAMSLQFKNDIPLGWEVEFDSLDGYGALTLGPIFQDINSMSKKDDFGILEEGRHYPATLVSALIGEQATIDSVYGTTTFVDRDDDFFFEEISEESGMPLLATVVYHELTHFYGFSDASCLGGCIPEDQAHPTGYSERLHYHKEDTLFLYDDLSLTEKVEAGKSGNDLLFLGSTETQDVFSQELSSGTQPYDSETYVEMMATPLPDGGYDNQAVSHVSDAVQPAQLMRSSAAHTTDLGVAAFLLCDIGWCRDQGHVIDLSAIASINENASTETETYIAVALKNNTNTPVDNVKASIRFDDNYPEFSVDSAEGCELSDGVLSCDLSFTALEEKEVLLSVGALSESGYSIAGEIYSDDYDVDRDGFNNILDTTLTISSDDGGSDDSNDDGGGDDGNDDGGGDDGNDGGSDSDDDNTGSGNSSDSNVETSGGSMSLGFFLLLGITGLLGRLLPVKKL